MRHDQLLALALALCLEPAACRAEPAPLDAQPVRVSTFNNESAMVASPVVVVPGVGTYQVATPEAQYGGLWLNRVDGLHLEQIVGTPVKRTEWHNTLSARDLFGPNLGRTFSIPGGEKDAWKIVTLLLVPQPAPSGAIQVVPYPLLHGYDGPVMPAAPRGDELIRLNTGQGAEARHLNSIHRIRFDSGKDERTAIERTVVEPLLRFDAVKADD